MIESRMPDAFEWRFGLVVCILLGVGVWTIFSATHDLEPSGSLPYFVKQLVWILCGCVAFAVAISIDYHQLARYSYVIYAVALVLLVLVLLAGRSSRGAQRWFALGPIAFQPSEFAKLVLVLVLAKYFAEVQRVGWMQLVVIPGLMTLPGLLLILKQPDLGTAMSFSFIFLAMVLIGGLHARTVGVTLLFSVMLFPFIWELFWSSLHDYQRERILTFWNPTIDPAGKGYHSIQSQIAIGAGGMWGRGIDDATQSRLRFLPEGHTDFIFAVFAEHWGFIGVVVLFALFALLIFLITEIANKAKDELGLLLAGGILAMLGFCLVVNVGMTMGLFPIVGIPLPLMSYGGTTTVVTMVALGLLLNVKRRRLRLFY